MVVAVVIGDRKPVDVNTAYCLSEDESCLFDIRPDCVCVCVYVH